jgi:general secretion pathway protein B
VTATTAATASATATPSATTTATATASTGASAATPAAKPASAAPAAAAIAPALSELPEEIRRLIPALTITGAVYSENPAQRLLLVNGQVLPQGASAASEVSIEEIRPRSATFSFRGTRFRVTY